jgi:hypothetical protein
MDEKINSDFSRRMFLRGLGGFTLGLPFLPSMASASALRAAIETPNKRFVAVWTPFGQYAGNYWPTFTPTTQVGPDVLSHPLAQIPGQPSLVVNSNRFAGLYPKLLLLRGLDCTEMSGHNFNAMLGAGRHTATEVTIDNMISQSSKVYSAEPIIRALHMRPSWKLDAQAGLRGISFAKIGETISMMPNYREAESAFNRVFNGARDSSGKRERVVDRVFASYQKLKKHSRLDNEDRQRLENHLNRLAELEQRFVSEKQISCRPPTLQADPGQVDWPTMNWDITVKNHIDVMVAALACGATKVSTLMFSGDNPYFNSSYHHITLAHNPDESDSEKKAQSLQVNDWYAKWVAYLMNQMDGIVEANGKTLLDNSVVFWGNEHSHGNGHSILGMPTLLGGSCAGYFNTGRYIDYRRSERRKRAGNDEEYMGRVYNQLLVTLVQAMGLSPADYETSRKQGLGSYYVSVKSEEDFYAPYLTLEQKRAPLPFI